MSSGFRGVDFDQLAATYNAFAPDRYRIDGELVRLNTVDSPLFDWGASLVADGGRGFVACKRSAGGRLYKGPDKDQAHLTLLAFDDARTGVDLLTEVKTILRDRGVTRLVFGQDSRHFFPGCPVDFSSIRNFLVVEGFEESGEQVDVERDLSDYQNPFPLVPDVEYRLVTAEDIPELEAFFDREFPDRWKYDVTQKIAIDGPGCVCAAFRGKRVDGFALIQHWENKVPIGGAVWRADLGDHWGALGPIGVAAGIRGHGEGNAMLGAALTELKTRGARRCIIDWTSLVKFYGGHGFQVSRTYRTAQLRLSD